MQGIPTGISENVWYNTKLYTCILSEPEYKTLNPI